MGDVLRLQLAAPRVWQIDATMTKSADRDFETFFVQNYEAIVRTLTTITGNRERAIDATQEAFIKAYARWPKIRSYDMPAAWVRRIAINASRDSYRSDRRRRRREASHPSGDVPSPADRIVADDGAFRILGTLPRRQREIATLFYIDDVSVSDIAHILRVSEGTVKSQLSEARDRMRATLEPKSSTP